MTTILVIEDEQPLREEIIEALHFEEFDVLGAADGPTGLAMAQQHIPDLIICDILMPQMDGYQVLMELRHHPETAGIPFIFLTAKVDRPFMRYGMELGADDYLTKPFSVVELLAAIHTRLARHATIAESGTLSVDQAQRRLSEMVAHELRTPLISITMAQDIISRQMEQLQPHQLHEFLEIVRSGSQRLRHVVEQMIFMTRLEAGVLSQNSVRTEGGITQLWDVLTAAINLARNFCYRNRTLSVRFDTRDQQALIVCHTDSLKHALAELITNALNFSPEDGEVIVSQWQSDNAAWISIVDRGPGIPPEHLERAFQDYQQIDRTTQEQQGMGLGLPLANRIIEAHQGKIELTSVVGKGTQVVVMLPLAPIE